MEMVYSIITCCHSNKKGTCGSPTLWLGEVAMNKVHTHTHTHTHIHTHTHTHAAHMGNDFRSDSICELVSTNQVEVTISSNVSN